MNNRTRKELFAQLFKKDRKSSDKNEQDRGSTDFSILYEYYKTVATHHPDLIFVLSAERETLFQNTHRVNKLLGYSKSKKLNYKDLVSMETYKALRKSFEHALKGSTKKLTIEATNSHQAKMHLDVTFIPIKMTSKTPNFIHVIVQDRTAYHHMLNNLQLKEKHFNHAQDLAAIGSWEYEIAIDKLTWTDNCYELFGFDKNENMSMDLPLVYVHDEDKTKLREKIKHAIINGVSYECEYRIVHGKTKEVRYANSKAEVTFYNGAPYKLIGVVIDITEQRLVEQELANQIKNLKHMFDHLDVGFWLQEYESRDVLYLSRGLATLYEYPLESLYKHKTFWEDSLHPEDKEQALKNGQSLETGQPIQHYYRILCGDGSVKWVFDQTIPWFDHDGKLNRLFGVQLDITHQREMEQKLQYQASHDPLTSLPNQKSLYEKLEHFCSNDAILQFALIYVDLDHFNRINHSLGYDIGDQALQKVAKRIQVMLPGDSYLARISGNDFAAIVPTYDHKKQVFSLAERIIKHVGTSMEIEDYELYLTASVGLSFYPENGDNKLSVLDAAHSALFHAKKQGKNNYQLYSFSRDISTYKKYLLEQDLRSAIEHEDFELYYQPVVHTATKRIAGAEALIRWNHETWGIVSPSEFIPIAEENHLIHDLGNWVIETVCAQLRKWKDGGFTMRPISINISPIRFLKKGLVNVVQHHLETYNIPAKYIQLEITESTQLKNERTVLMTLQELKNLGVKIAIDDFGTGYASLSYLNKFHADTIKIDQTFIERLHEMDNHDLAIVSSIIYLAKKLEVITVAEGVELYEQYEILKQNECDFIQGYIFSKPVPASVYEKLMRKGHLELRNQQVKDNQREERRSYYRLKLPTWVPAQMNITEVNKRKVDLGSATILIEDISLGGIKILSTLRLPVNTSIKLNFSFTLVHETFDIAGNIVWKKEGNRNVFHYGISFRISESERDHLAGAINRLTVLKNTKQKITGTGFIEESPEAYFNQNPL
ncbi:EAL domain-containing protein [Virgibacillus sp. W0430]|uniref:EAL domain-containing protein n=1 Tax=Virgibacillus sp. W0430 TaxID=3391580 RepID=UPI003F47D784